MDTEVSPRPTTDLPEHLLEVLRGLTAQQQKAVRHTEGPLLVLAGPGSGKTRVITRRIAFLIGCGVPAYQILAVTFTNKAAAEMRERVSHLLGEGALSRGLTVTTFHALCARLLRKYADIAGIPGLTGTFVIYDTDDQTAIVKRAIEECNLSTSVWPARSVLGRISAAKNDLIDAQEFERRAFDFNSRTLAKVYTAYQRGLRTANAVDFDDLLLLSAQMLRNNARVRGECQARWRYLLVDEYQDTNKAQFVIAGMIAGAKDSATTKPTAADSTSNICVVGDPDQSIYGWRGANIENILQFEEQFPGAQVIPLGENFRSTGHIIQAADALIRHNAKRKHKDLFTANPPGEKASVVLCRDEHHEARLVVDWIKERRVSARGGELAWKDFAVFYRTNALSRVVEDVLRNEGIPYVIARGTAFYQREEIKSALAYLRVIANPADEVSLLRIINTPARGLGDTTIDRVQTSARERGITIMDTLAGSLAPLGLTARAVTAAAKFVEMMRHFSGIRSDDMLHTPAADGSLAELVERVIRESGLETMYREQAEKSKTDADAERVENLDELISSARDFETSYDPANDPAADAPLDPEAKVPPPSLWQLLRAYLERVTLVADADSVDPAQGAVTLMTLHAAKGLEFAGVAMVGLEEGLLPHSRVAENPGELEEERRLCFVGVTRAMRQLLITSARYRTTRGILDRTIPSRFLSELPKANVTLSDQAGEDSDWDSSDAPSTSRGPASRGEPANAWGRKTITDARGVPVSVGESVRHPQFGIGTIEGITGGADARAQIRFRDAGLKTLVLQYARLEKLQR